MAPAHTILVWSIAVSYLVYFKLIVLDNLPTLVDGHPFIDGNLLLQRRFTQRLFCFLNQSKQVVGLLLSLYQLEQIA